MLKNLATSTFAAALVLLPVGAQSAPTTCPEHFVGGNAPDLANPKLAAKTRAICYSEYAVLHSGVTRTPLWSAEHLTRQQLDAANDLKRSSSFHADPNLPPDERAELSDYARSGFDRGHMVPAGDMPDKQSMDESFSLANMVPQVPDSNRGIWERIESAVRDLVNRDGELYVVTGPVFQGATLQRLHGRVLVPTHVYKAIYDPKRRQAGAYLVPNAKGDEWQAVSIARLQELTGIAMFPDLPASITDTAMSLPEPKARGRRRDR
jgi:endonuclease G